jgi:hypothetical protein
MKVKFEDTEFDLSEKAIGGLVTFVLEFLQSIRNSDSDEVFKECWTWGVITIDNFNRTNAVTFYYGGDEDKPDLNKLKDNQMFVPLKSK